MTPRRHLAMLCLLGAMAMRSAAAQTAPRTISTVAVLSPAEVLAFQEASRLENGGQPARAVDMLKPLLEKSPADFRFLGLMEQSYSHLDKRAEMLPWLQRAIARDSMSIGVLGVAVRVHAGLLQADSARKYAARWYALVPGNPTPYREWSEAASEVRDGAGALLALEEGRRAIGSATALSPEIAQAQQVLGNYAAATQEWLQALSLTPTFRAGALMLIEQAPPGQRPVVYRELIKAGTPDATQLHGLLLVHWGEVATGAAMVRDALPSATDRAVSLLQDLVSELRLHDDKASLLAQGQALESLAGRQGGGGAAESRLLAARAYAEAGADRDARRLLTTIAADPDAPPGSASYTTTLLLGALIAEGRAAQADSALASVRGTLGEEEYAKQRRRVALLWVRQGRGDRAEALVTGDSTVGGIDVLGRIRLVRGDLKGAEDALRYAGPFDDVRAQAVSRITILTLLQAVAMDSSPRLGAAFLALETGDSSAALRLFDSLAVTFQPAGAAAVRMLAGEIARDMGDAPRAMLLFQAADVPGFPGIAAAARLECARLLAAAGKRDEARQLAERLILEFPESAVLPDARRLRDEVRGAVPGGKP